MISATSLGIRLVLDSHTPLHLRPLRLASLEKLVDLPAAVDLVVAYSGSTSAMVDDHSGDHAPLKL